MTAAAAVQPKIQSVQALRFFAATAVVFSHSADLALSRDSWVWTVPWTSGVDVFFVISGFIMHRLTVSQFGRPDASRRFFLRRLIRIVPPYWIVTLATMAVVAALGGQVRNTRLDPDIVAASLLFVPWPRVDGLINPIVSQGWTLNYEMFFYAAFAVALMSRDGLKWLAGGFVALVLAHPFIPKGWFIAHFLSSAIILEFLAGIALSWIYGKGWRMAGPWPLICLALGLALLVGIASLTYEGNGFKGIMLVPAFLLCAAAVLREPPLGTSRGERWLVLGGDLSYGLYLIHYLVVNAVALAWSRFVPASPVLQILVSMAVALLAALVFYRLVERPMTTALHRRFAPR